MARENMMRGLRSLLRFLQFAFALVALATVARGFVTASYYGYSSMLGSRAATYTLLMTYTAMLVGLYFFVAVELMRLFPRPAPLLVEQIIDLLLTILLLVAGIVLVVSDYVKHCSVFGYMLRCNMLQTGVVFTFLAAAASLALFFLSCCEGFVSKRGNTGGNSSDEGGPMQRGTDPNYHAGATPTGAGTPKDASSRV